MRVVVGGEDFSKEVVGEAGGEHGNDGIGG